MVSNPRIIETCVRNVRRGQSYQPRMHIRGRPHIFMCGWERSTWIEGSHRTLHSQDSIAHGLLSVGFLYVLDSSIVQAHQSISAASDRWIVRDHHDGQAITMLFGDEVENLLAGRFVEVAGRLVSE